MAIEDVGMQPDARQHRRIGADHHHLAMGHVDDAHGAVGDGETERHQQQDRAEAQADEQTFESWHSSKVGRAIRRGGRCLMQIRSS